MHSKSIHRVQGSLGHVPTTSNVAEYAGLLAGLYGLLRSETVPEKAAVRVTGDSELVIKQLNGDYAVNDAKLRVYHAAVQQQLARFASVELHHVPRGENAEADTLARTAITSPPKLDTAQLALFYPNLGAHAQVVCGGMTVPASHNKGTATWSGHCLIDAKFLSAAYGPALAIQDAHPIQAVRGKDGFYPVVGRLVTLPLRVAKYAGVSETYDLHIPDVLVVDGLPVPLHLDVHAHPNVGNVFSVFSMGFGDRFDAAVFPEAYRAHPYWACNTAFIASATLGCIHDS
ncbi:hypothetical protein HDU86_006083 [Geranomyces michiganensis]|nr:hypothetical protein HDU86_006083 [Geranomyces michiganensis]